MAKLRKDVTLGAVIHRAHEENIRLVLRDKAKHLLEQTDTGTTDAVEKLKNDIDIFFGDGQAFDAQTKEWGMETQTDPESYVLAAFAQLLSNWKTPGKDVVETTLDGSPFEAFKLTCVKGTQHQDTYLLENDSEFEVFISTRASRKLSAEFLDELIVAGGPVSIIIPKIDIEAKQDYSTDFHGSLAIHDECRTYDIDEVVTSAKVKLDKTGVEVKQLTKMTMVMSGCLAPMITKPVRVRDSFVLGVSKKIDGQRVPLFELLIEQSDFELIQK